jgi:hypothetical protein
MTKIIRIEGKVRHVFRTIDSICTRHPAMNLKELMERGLKA